MKKGFVALVFLSLIELVSAYNGWGGSWSYGFSPSELLQNEWVLFALVFLLFFAIIYLAIGKPFKENRMAALVIAAIISFLIASAFTQRAYFYKGLSEEVFNWVLILAVLIAIVFILRATLYFIGPIGFAITLLGLWFIFYYEATTSYFLYSLDEPLYSIAQALVTPIGGVVVGLISILILVNAKKISRWMRRGRRKIIIGDDYED